MYIALSIKELIYFLLLQSAVENEKKNNIKEKIAIQKFPKGFPHTLLQKIIKYPPNPAP